MSQKVEKSLKQWGSSVAKSDTLIKLTKRLLKWISFAYQFWVSTHYCWRRKCPLFCSNEGPNPKYQKSQQCGPKASFTELFGNTGGWIFYGFIKSNCLKYVLYFDEICVRSNSKQHLVHIWIMYDWNRPDL